MSPRRILWATNSTTILLGFCKFRSTFRCSHPSRTSTWPHTVAPISLVGYSREFQSAWTGRQNAVELWRRWVKGCSQSLDGRRAPTAPMLALMQCHKAEAKLLRPGLLSSPCSCKLWHLSGWCQRGYPLTFAQLCNWEIVVMQQVSMSWGTSGAVLSPYDPSSWLLYAYRLLIRHLKLCHASYSFCERYIGTPGTSSHRQSQLCQWHRNHSHYRGQESDSASMAAECQLYFLHVRTEMGHQPLLHSLRLSRISSKKDRIQGHGLQLPFIELNNDEPAESSTEKERATMKLLQTWSNTKKKETKTIFKRSLKDNGGGSQDNFGTELQYCGAKSNRKENQHFYGRKGNT